MSVRLTTPSKILKIAGVAQAGISREHGDGTVVQILADSFTARDMQKSCFSSCNVLLSLMTAWAYTDTLHNDDESGSIIIMSAVPGVCQL